MEDTMRPENLFENQATIKVERRVKGYVPNIVTVCFPDPGAPLVQKGQRSLFFFQRGPGGYAFTGVQPADNADVIAQLVKEFPVALTLVPPAGPFYFGLSSFVTVKVKNNSAVPLTVGFYTVDSYYHALSMYDETGQPPLDTIAPIQAMGGGGPEYPDSDPIPPGGEGLVNISAGAFKSQAWNKLPTDQYLHTLITLRARLTLTFRTAEGNAVIWRGIASPWITTTLGYAPPGDQNFRFPLAQ